MPSRRAIRTVLVNVVADLLATVAAIVLSFYLRFQDDRLAAYVRDMPLIVAAILPVAAIVFLLVGLPNSKWRFTSLPDLIRIVKASAVLSVLLLLADSILSHPSLLGVSYFGRAWILLFFLLEMLMLAGPRAAYRALKQRQAASAVPRREREGVLILGTGFEAEPVLRAIETGPLSRFNPLGILSPRGADAGQSIRGVAVRGTFDNLDSVLRELAARGAAPRSLVMAPSALSADANPGALLAIARRFGVQPLRTQLETGDLDDDSRTQLAPVSMEDLLLRPTVTIDEASIVALVRNRRIAITGGGGSIGGELARRLARYGAADILILENSEPALHAILEDLARVPTCRAQGRICDVRDRERIFAILADFQPQIVYHAAALKHVHYLERDWSEGIRTNVFGAINAADAAIAAGAEAFVMISTDKAVKPVSILGATKRFAEMYVQAKDFALSKGNGGSPTRLVVVRFGNVLGSNGSVVPKFREQIEKGGPITVTHPDMVRYFMTIPEACDLVVVASMHAVDDPEKSTSIYVLNMGRPVKILDLAKRMIELAGLRAGEDIRIEFTGMRPGERLEEIVLDDTEATHQVNLPGIIAADPSFPDVELLDRWLTDIATGLAGGDQAAVYEVLAKALPTFPAVPKDSHPKDSRPEGSRDHAPAAN